MTRSAKNDPCETFRFEVRIISISLNPTEIARGLKNGGFSQFARAGFTGCTIPEVTHGVMEYRENTDNFVMRKMPGLAKFNPITLTRGVLPSPPQQVLQFTKNGTNKDFFAWASSVTSFNPALQTINEITGTSRNNISRQSQSFRKDMIIIQRDREGGAARRWYVLNAWPVSYKGGSDLDANTESKSIESLTLQYEIAFELPSVADAAREFVANLLDSESLYGDLLQDLDLGF
jgi:phage tail-like protein